MHTIYTCRLVQFAARLGKLNLGKKKKKTQDRRLSDRTFSFEDVRQVEETMRGRNRRSKERKGSVAQMKQTAVYKMQTYFPLTMQYFYWIRYLNCFI